MNILIIDDDEMSRLGLSLLLKERGVLFEFSSSKLFLSEINRFNFDIAFIDLDIDEKLDGFDVVEALSAKGVYCVVLTGREEDQNIVKAYELGAKDYLVKPVDLEKIDFIFKKNQITNHDTKLVRDIKSAIVGKQNILLRGESGTGKTKLSNVVYEYFCSLNDKSVKDVPFVSVNCNEIAAGLFESEFFGHKKGAFTGADSDKVGLIERADGGVLFLDEIGALSIASQVKLLKVLEEKSYYRVGDSKKRISNFFLICATCDDLEVLIQENLFRKDLFHRINDQVILLQPFRDFSKEEKLELVKSIISKLPSRFVLSPEATEAICNYSWPGNLRELEKFLKNASVNVSGLLKIEDCSFHSTSSIDYSSLIARAHEIGLTSLVDEISRFVINSTLKENHSKVRKTIDDLKISNNTFYKYIKD